MRSNQNLTVHQEPENEEKATKNALHSLEVNYIYKDKSTRDMQREVYY